MLRLSRMADYSFLTLVALARGGAGQSGVWAMAAPELSAATGLPAPTVSKVLKKMTRAGILLSRRGAGGGYALARPIAAVTVAEVVAAIDGPVALTACVPGAARFCGVADLCPVRGRWEPVNTAVRAALETVTVAELAPPAGEAAP